MKVNSEGQNSLISHPYTTLSHLYYGPELLVFRSSAVILVGGEGLRLSLFLETYLKTSAGFQIIDGLLEN
jgi:hypothetical protein